MTKSRKRIPKKFKGVKKSFVDKILVEGNILQRESFLAFPESTNFYGKDTDEDIILIIRSHWIVYIPGIFLSILILLIPIIFLYLSSLYPMLGSPVMYIGMLLLCAVISVNIIITTIMKWFYTVNIITDQRIVVIEMNSVLGHSYAETQLEKIQDLTHKHTGILGTFFDFGDVYIDTAGHGIDFKLHTIPRPRDVQDVINDLLEMKQNGEI